MLKLVNVCKTFYSDGKEFDAVKNVSLEIQKGEIFGIIGLSGAGKSTLIRCMNRLETPTSGDILTVAAASAGIGAVTAVLARHRPPLLTAAAGLLAGQGLVHLVLSTGHTHGLGTGHTGHHGADPAAVRAAMDSAGTESAGAGHMASLLTPQMLGAHIAAVVLTVTVVTILTRTLAWVAARVAPLLGRVHLVVVAPLLTSYNALAPRARHLLTGGGTRAPPAAV